MRQLNSTCTPSVHVPGSYQNWVSTSPVRHEYDILFEGGWMYLISLGWS